MLFLLQFFTKILGRVLGVFSVFQCVQCVVSTDPNLWLGLRDKVLTIDDTRLVPICNQVLQTELES